jgi:hypothetical protein
MPTAILSKRVKMIWGLSLHSWEDVMRFSLVITGIFGLIAGLSTWFVVNLQRVELAESKIEFEQYRLEISERTEKLKADNLETEKIIQRREFPIGGVNGDASSINKELEKFSGIKVWVQTVPDFESNRLTVSLTGLFRAVGWQASEVGPLQTGVSSLGISEGVRILIRYPYDKFPPPPDAARDRLWDAAQLLVKRLQMDSALGSNFFSVHWGFLTFPSPNGVITLLPRAEVPDDTMLILVGMKPISALLSEKNAKALPTHQNADK